MDLGKALFRYDGRIGRKEYWAFVGISFGASFLAGFVDAAAGVENVMTTLVSLALIYPNICVNAQRLHDLNRSGWWQLSPLAVLIAALLIGGGGMLALGGETTPGMVVIGVFLAAAVVYAIGFFLWLGIARGVPQDNRWGPPAGTAAPQTAADVFA